jgi:hypothetical protein
MGSDNIHRPRFLYPHVEDWAVSYCYMGRGTVCEHCKIHEESRLMVVTVSANSALITSNANSTSMSILLSEKC